MEKNELKPAFEERIRKLLKDEADFKEFVKIANTPPVNSIRCNTLKITPEKLKQRLEKKGWKIKQPFNEHPEIMIIESNLLPGEIGRAIEHMLGYYYVQEISSMLPVLALKPKENETILDLCAAPGSKTTQIAAEMKNTGTLIANEISIGRIKILANNTEKCGVTNTIITRKDGTELCERLKNNGIEFDKIFLDAPCSGEGTLRSSVKTAIMWNINTIRSMSKLQKALFESAFEVLKVGGEILYSTCTHAPEENEEIVNFALEKFKGRIKIEIISLPIKCRPGVVSWQDKTYSNEVKASCRIYPQDNNTEGFFLAKFKKIK